MDRFAELKGGRTGGGGGGGPGEDTNEARGLVSPNDVHVGGAAGGGGGGGDSVFMARFFEDVARIRGDLTRIRRNVAQISEEHQTSLATVMTTEQAKEHTDRLDSLIDDTSGMASGVQNALNAMKKGNESFAKEESSTPSECQIRQNMHSTLTRKFVEVMTQYQEVQTAYKARLRDRVERQVKIVKPDASSADVDAAMHGDAGSIFKQEIIHQGAQHSAAKNALLDIQSKHADIVKLEASILELQQLFNDMAVLVEAQGELLDSIEHNVTTSLAHVEKGVRELQQARKHQKKGRKLMCILIFLFIAIGIAIMIPVLTRKKDKAEEA